MSFKCKRLPLQRTVLDRPMISAHLGGTHVGYLAFIEDSEFTLECYTYENSLALECRDLGFKAEK